VTDLAELVLFCVIGRIFIYLWMEFPLPRQIDSIKFFHDLHACDLCSGLYLFAILAWATGIDILQMLGFTNINGFIRVVITGGAISFLVHLLTLGFKEKFMSFVIE